ncbi:hypothetical protein EXIGLDRAFT_698811 [Exidia glandulosa HHB12029]|uniref:Uncharacterized protein n=1 Tax=Exidia glandulosa HHB12029 TaxID=1314781 RepID=A0A165MJ39_EXIGL|nr:hypothetical protein EXIGLDRAFT_698811 [Exidia glandulosa HHB12029]
MLSSRARPYALCLQAQVALVDLLNDGVLRAVQLVQLVKAPALAEHANSSRRHHQVCSLSPLALTTFSVDVVDDIGGLDNVKLDLGVEPGSQRALSSYQTTCVGSVRGRELDAPSSTPAPNGCPLACSNVVLRPNSIDPALHDFGGINKTISMSYEMERLRLGMTRSGQLNVAGHALPSPMRRERRSIAVGCGTAKPKIRILDFRYGTFTPLVVKDFFKTKL